MKLDIDLEYKPKTDFRALHVTKTYLCFIVVGLSDFYCDT
jgi:hypothetical protein